MKSVLISTQPKWCEKICRKIGEENGLPVYLKPVEVRKSAPKEVPFRAYLYCTNGRFDITDIDDLTSESVRVVSEGRGKVIGEFVCDRVVKIRYEYCDHPEIGYPVGYDCGDNWWEWDDEETNLCLSDDELNKYACGLKRLYGWHISDLKIYDTPRELSDFKTPDKPYHEIIERDGSLMFMDGYESGKPLKRAPQSWQYVEEK